MLPSIMAFKEPTVLRLQNHCSDFYTIGDIILI